MQVLLSHPTGNANVRNLANGLLESKILAAFYTTIASFPKTMLYKLSQLNSFSEIRRRQFDKDLQYCTSVYPWFETGRLLASKLNLNYLTKHETGTFSIDNVYKTLDQHVARQLRKKTNSKIDAVYAYEDGAEFSFVAAKQSGMTCLYDLPIGYWRTAGRLLAIERERWPEWSATLTGFKDSTNKLERKDKELQLADRIFVASSFTANTLTDYSGTLAPVSVIPYGFPTPYVNRKFDTPVNRPLKLLFVGGLSQRKGIADLFSAVENIGNDVELTIIGRKTTSDCKALNSALSKHRWIPSLPHEEILKVMRQHDVLVFPSLFEGFGLVITEAMSQGTPVITTNRTAGPNLITHGKNGWITEAGNMNALQQSIEHLLQYPDDIALAGMAAIETAQNRPWSRYGEEMAQAILSMKMH